MDNHWQEEGMSAYETGAMRSGKLLEGLFNQEGITGEEIVGTMDKWASSALYYLPKVQAEGNTEVAEYIQGWLSRFD